MNTFLTKDIHLLTHQTANLATSQQHFCQPFVILKLRANLARYSNSHQSRLHGSRPSSPTSALVARVGQVAPLGAAKQLSAPVFTLRPLADLAACTCARTFKIPDQSCRLHSLSDFSGIMQYGILTGFCFSWTFPRIMHSDSNQNRSARRSCMHPRGRPRGTARDLRSHVLNDQIVIQSVLTHEFDVPAPMPQRRCPSADAPAPI